MEYCVVMCGVLRYGGTGSGNMHSEVCSNMLGVSRCVQNVEGKVGIADN